MRKGWIVTEDCFEYDDERYYTTDTTGYVVSTQVFTDHEKAAKCLQRNVYDFWKINAILDYYETVEDFTDLLTARELARLEPMLAVEEDMTVREWDKIEDINMDEFSDFIQALFKNLSFENLSEYLNRFSSPFSIRPVEIDD